MASLDEIKSILENTGKAFEEFKEKYNNRLDEIERKANKAQLGGRGPDMREGVSPEEVKDFLAFCRTGERKAAQMIAGVDPAGGYTMPRQMADRIVEVGAEEGAIRGLARVEKVDNSNFEQPVATNLAGASHVGETSSRDNTTTPDFAMFKPGIGGLAAVAPVSNWALSDSQYDLAQFLLGSIGQQFGVTEGYDFVMGNGVSRAMGIASYTLAATADDTRAWGQVEKLNAGSTSAITIDNLIDLRGKLKPRYRKRAAWVFHPDTETALRKLKAAGSGDYYWQPATAAGAPDTLLGIPCHLDVNVPTIGSGNPAVWLADWKKFYCVVDVGPQIAIRDQVTVKGKTLFYVEKRVTGGVLDFNAGKALVMT